MAPEGRRGQSRTPILFVEDNDETRYAVQRLLELEGYTVAATDDPLAALDLLRTRAPISLVVLDLHLPQMDGFAFLQRMQEDPMIQRAS